MIRWILLDIDDTLIDYTTANQCAFERMMMKVHDLTQLPIELLKESYAIIKRSFISDF